MRIGLLHPGSMGAAVGAVLRAVGHEVLWAPEGRSAGTRARAAAAGLTAAADLADLLRQVEVVLAICPPHAAVELAEQVAAAGFARRYVDANALAPRTAQTVAETVTAAGARYVDGSLIGPPPREAGTTRLYLSGPGARDVARVFAGSRLEARHLAGGPLAASALKMAYGGWTKGSAALLLTMRALAAAAGVEDDLVAEWRRSIPDLPDRSQRTAERVTAKAWRFVGEMEEVAAACREHDLPPAFHEAAAEAYRRLAPLRDEPPAADDALAALRGASDPHEVTR